MQGKSKLSYKEREILSKLHYLLNEGFIVRGSIVEMKNTCGKKGCKCIREGEKHINLYLSCWDRGKHKMKYIPKGKEEEVKGWVKRYKEVQGLIEELSKIRWGRLKKD